MRSHLPSADFVTFAGIADPTRRCHDMPMLQPFPPFFSLRLVKNQKVRVVFTRMSLNERLKTHSPSCQVCNSPYLRVRHELHACREVKDCEGVQIADLSALCCESSARTLFRKCRVHVRSRPASSCWKHLVVSTGICAYHKIIRGRAIRGFSLGFDWRHA